MFGSSYTIRMAGAVLDSVISSPFGSPVRWTAPQGPHPHCRHVDTLSVHNSTQSIDDWCRRYWVGENNAGIGSYGRSDAGQPSAQAAGPVRRRRASLARRAAPDAALGTRPLGHAVRLLRPG